jgi:hypothetical protein
MGLTSSRHAHLKFTVVDAIKRFGPPTANVHDFEPSRHNLATRSSRPQLMLSPPQD